MDVDGVVQGTIPQSDMFGFRWSAVNNLFLTAGDIAGDEWRASRATDEENAERELRQFVWCLPVVPNKWDETSLESHELSTRVVPLTRGVSPGSTTIVTAALDLGKYPCHWIVVAWSPQAEGHLVDYGRIEVPSADLGVEQGILVALREFKELMLNGWATHSASGDERVLPQQVWIDAGYMPDVVYSFCREAGERFRPAIGRGAAQQRHQWYNRPTSTGSTVRHIGEGFHMNWVPTEHLYLVEIDADHWKTWVHQRLTTPLARPGAMTLYQATPQEHLALAKHLTAEIKTEEFVSGRGVVVKWERLRRQNHWFDALYNASAAGSFCGVQLVEEMTIGQPQQASTDRSIELGGVDAAVINEVRERMSRYLPW